MLMLMLAGQTILNLLSGRMHAVGIFLGFSLESYIHFPATALEKNHIVTGTVFDRIYNSYDDLETYNNNPYMG